MLVLYDLMDVYFVAIMHVGIVRSSGTSTLCNQRIARNSVFQEIKACPIYDDNVEFLFLEGIATLKWRSPSSVFMLLLIAFVRSRSRFGFASESRSLLGPSFVPTSNALFLIRGRRLLGGIFRRWCFRIFHIVVILFFAFVLVVGNVVLVPYTTTSIDKLRLVVVVLGIDTNALHCVAARFPFLVGGPFFHARCACFVVRCSHLYDNIRRGHQPVLTQCLFHCGFVG
mmetsp:Transcript_25571/g.60272  ORF Transcript_25571/g.60272 Transcript_25571/m.60272 type:complete len:227 (+) Transcript_25571:3-683(+)